MKFLVTTKVFETIQNSSDLKRQASCKRANTENNGFW